MYSRNIGDGDVCDDKVGVAGVCFPPHTNPLSLFLNVKLVLGRLVFAILPRAFGLSIVDQRRPQLLLSTAALYFIS